MFSRVHIASLMLVLAALPAAPSALAQEPPPASTAPPETVPAPPPAPPPGTPTPQQLYRDGHAGRYLMGGQWLFRRDPAGGGLKARLFAQRTRKGWRTKTVPNAWNAGDNSDRSMTGGVVWYRKDFRVPSRKSALDWLVRFESVNYRARIWLNGVEIGHHTGAYLPFELRLPGLKRNRLNRMVLRIDNRRGPTDFPPSGFNSTGQPVGGWWNYGGILREVYLRRVQRVALGDVVVRPRLGCVGCAADIDAVVPVMNLSSRAQRVRARVRFGDVSTELGQITVAPGRKATLKGSMRLEAPHLWSPTDPFLYEASVDLLGRGSRAIARFELRSGVRMIKVRPDGRILLNDRLLNVRGVGIHEDDSQRGFAIDNPARERIVNRVRELGGTMLRSHYPLHPYIQELADRLGLLIWSEIPVYSLKTKYFRRADVRALAARELRENITVNGNHPSVAIWSIGNELTSRPERYVSAYIKRAARTAHRLDPTRPVGLAIVGYPSSGCQASAYRELDVLGINEYFGWYTGPGGQVADRDELSAYLDAFRECYPGKGAIVTEFGAEANREGPAEEKGTYAFQQEFLKYHLGVFATKPWLSGALWWTLQEFRVRPGWDGGNPRPQPPIHQKGVIDYAGTPKPAFADMQSAYRATVQFEPLTGISPLTPPLVP